MSENFSGISSDWCILDHITPLVLTWNEEDNIGRVLEKLRWANEVVVLDSGSTDKTIDICSSFKNVRTVKRPFDNFSSQCNYGLKNTEIKAPWVLSMDADYVLSDNIIDELKTLRPGLNVNGYRISFKYCIEGRPLSGSLYPPRVSLYRRENARYVQDGHAHRVIVEGEVGDLACAIHHDDRKPLSRWLEAQNKYMEIEADMISVARWSDLRLADKLRRLIIISPPVVFIYCLIIKRGLLDGKFGLYYAIQRTIAEMILSMKLIQHGIVKHE